MRRRLMCCTIVLVAGAIVAGEAGAAPPFTEDFSGGTAGWRFNTANSPPLVGVGSGGPDGGAFARNNLASLTGSMQSPNTVLLFRAHKTYAGIDLGYTGDWITAGVKQVSAFVRHDAPQPLEFVARFSPEANFPGAFYATTSLVPSGAWTQITFNVTPASPQNVTYEGGTHQQVFQAFDNSGVANMQFGVTIPAGLSGTGPYVFDFDKVNVSLTPEPSAAVLTVVGVAAASFVRRRRGPAAA
jgi:hypothetical protein